MLQTWFHTFATDTKVHVALLLVLADFVFGVSAALKAGTFRFSFIADLLRKDVLGKLIPYFGLYIFALVAGQNNILPINGLDWGLAAGAAYTVLVVALGGSVLSSLRELGIELPLPSKLSKAATAPEGQ